MLRSPHQHQHHHQQQLHRPLHHLEGHGGHGGNSSSPYPRGTYLLAPNALKVRVRVRVTLT